MGKRAKPAADYQVVVTGLTEPRARETFERLKMILRPDINPSGGTILMLRGSKQIDTHEIEASE